MVVNSISHVGWVLVPSGPLESISKQFRSLQIVDIAGFFVFVLIQIAPIRSKNQ
jgi:hypothetical protein